MIQDPQKPQSPPQIDLDSAIEQLRQKFQVPKVLVDRMTQQESGGNTTAVSPKGAKGRFQVMPGTLATINRETGKNLNNDDPLDNAYAGLYLLKQNYDKFKPGTTSERGAWMRSVAAYHAGAGNVQKDLQSGGLGIPNVDDGMINTRDHVYAIFSGTKPEDFGQQPSQIPAPIKTPRVTSTIKDDAGEEIPTAAPLKFTPDTTPRVGVIGRAAQNLSQRVAMQNMKLPANHPDLLGPRLEAKFDHQPTPEEVNDALLEQLGKGYSGVGRNFARETGQSLVGNAAIEKQPDGSYIAHGRTTQGLINAINAYAQGGRSAYENTIASQQVGRGAVARDLRTALKQGEGIGQDIEQSGARAYLGAAQTVQNVNSLLHGRAPEDDPTARAIARAREGIPQSTTWTGGALGGGIETLGTIAQAEGLGGNLPLQQALENAQAGPQATYKAGILSAPLVAAGPIGRAVGADELSPIARQATLRGIAGLGLGGAAAASGASPSEILKQTALGAAFPVGAKEPVRHVDLQARDEAGQFREETPKETEARRAQVSQPTAEVNAPQPASNPPVAVTSPTSTAEPPMTGIAHRVETQVRGEEPVRGTAVSTEESVQRGRDLLNQSDDPGRLVAKTVTAFDRTGAVSPESMAIVRAQHEQLAGVANQAFDQGGVNSPEFKAAEQARRDFYDNTVKPMQTAWSNTGRAQMGETPIDTTTQYGLMRAFHDTNGRDMNVREQGIAKSLSDNSARAEKVVADTQQRLVDTLNKICPP